MAIEREILKIVVVGHVDHGKSTLIGRLLYDTKSLPEGAIERVKRICKEKGKPFEYAYLLDAFEEEQKQGITIDTTQLQFFTEKREYVIIDAPGHKQFLKNMISGAANAEAALLIIDAQEGIQEQSKRHGYILSLLGIQKVYVIVNKMDLIDYSEEKFNEIKFQMNEFLNNLHVYPLKYIPISAFHGENITQISEKMPWYQGEPILKAIDLIEKDRGLEDKPLRFPIQDVYKFDQRRIIAGRIETGRLQVGDEILINPGGKVTRVKTIENWVEKDKKTKVSAGMSVGITVEDEFFNQRGEVITHVGQGPYIANALKANLFWMGKTPLVKGKKYKFKLVTQEVECEIITIHKVIDASTLAAIEDAREIKAGDVAEVTIKTKEQISFDEFKNNPNTGRFVLVDGYDVSGGGIISGTVGEILTTTKFVSKDLFFPVTCFDEYYYAFAEQQLVKKSRRPTTFAIGDVAPLSGDTYTYPENINIVNISMGLIASIGKASLLSIEHLAGHKYNGVPMIEANGAAIKIASAEEYQRFTAELEGLNLDNKEQFEDFANKWLDLTKYRKIKYKATLNSSEIEYHI
ncbi:GTP-binding protein [Bacillota bacterium LX-D]|nr:GTP-binding protein [Bacillota bacterium LX-D]